MINGGKIRVKFAVEMKRVKNQKRMPWVRRKIIFFFIQMGRTLLFFCIIVTNLGYHFSSFSTRNISTTTIQKINDLGVDNIGGVFVVLLCGLAFAILVAILEFCWNSKKNAQNERQSLCSEMAEELRFAVRCHGSRQRPALKRNCVKCSPAGQHTYVPSSFALPHHFGV